MADTACDSVPHGGQDQDRHPDQELPPNSEAPGPSNQEGQQPEEPVDNHEMQGAVAPKIIERKECKHLLERIGFSGDVARIIVQDHGYDTAVKLSCLKPNEVDILIKTLQAPSGERPDGTRDLGISVPHSAHQVLISVCFILFHHIHCDLCPSLNLLDEDVFH